MCAVLLYRSMRRAFRRDRFILRLRVGTVRSHVAGGGVAVEQGTARYFGWAYSCIGGWFLLRGHLSCIATYDSFG